MVECHYLSSDHLSLDHLVGGGVGWGLGQAVGAVGTTPGRALQVCFLSLQCLGMDYNFGGGGKPFHGGNGLHGEEEVELAGSAYFG